MAFTNIYCLQNKILQLPLCQLEICSQKCGIHTCRPLRLQLAVRHLSRGGQNSKRGLCGNRQHIHCKSAIQSGQHTAGHSSVTVDVGQEPVSSHALQYYKHFCRPVHHSNLQQRLLRLKNQSFIQHGLRHVCDLLQILIETGEIGRQANGAVMLTCGKTVGSCWSPRQANVCSKQCTIHHAYMQSTCRH